PTPVEAGSDAIGGILAGRKVNAAGAGRRRPRIDAQITSRGGSDDGEVAHHPDRAVGHADAANDPARDLHGRRGRVGPGAVAAIGGAGLEQTDRTGEEGEGATAAGDARRHFAPDAGGAIRDAEIQVTLVVADLLASKVEMRGGGADGGG